MLVISTIIVRLGAGPSAGHMCQRSCVMMTPGWDATDENQGLIERARNEHAVVLCLMHPAKQFVYKDSIDQSGVTNKQWHVAPSCTIHLGDAW